MYLICAVLVASSPHPKLKYLLSFLFKCQYDITYYVDESKYLIFTIFIGVCSFFFSYFQRITTVTVSIKVQGKSQKATTNLTNLTTKLFNCYANNMLKILCLKS